MSAKNGGLEAKKPERNVQTGKKEMIATNLIRTKGQVSF